MSVNKVVKIFKYDNNFRYIGSGYVNCNADESYILPPNSTVTKPDDGLVFDNKTSFLIFDLETKNWKVIDFENEMVINKFTKEIAKKNIYNYLNPDFISNIPSARILSYVEWNAETQGWKIADENREAVLGQLWELRKFIRNSECGKDLEYNGHLYHVNKRSLFDIFMTTYTMKQDETTVWITADNTDESVTLTKEDLDNILIAYRKRREKLVLEANEKWKEDEKLTTDELFIEFEKVYKESLSYLNSQQ